MVAPATYGGWWGVDVLLASAPSLADLLVAAVLLSQENLLQHSATALYLTSAHQGQWDLSHPL